MREQLTGLNLPRVVQCFEQARSRTTQYLTEIEPVRDVPSVLNAPREDLEHWRSLGVEAIQAGSVAVVIMSGGQGTRLGYEGPKGMYNICLPSGKSMFQMHFERVIRVKHLCRRDDGRVPSIPIYVMTSELNDTVIRCIISICVDWYVSQALTAPASTCTQPQRILGTAKLFWVPEGGRGLV